MASGNYTPDGWDAGWNAAKAAISTTPANVALIGDSIMAGGDATNFNATSVRALIRNYLVQAFGLYADYIPNFSNVFGVNGAAAWTSSGGNTNFRWGFGYVTVPNGTGGTNTVTFTSPYPCPQIDIIYLDQWPGTWSYNLDGAGNVTVTNQNNNANTAQSYAIKRLPLKNLNPSLKHSIVFAPQSASDTCVILGCVAYPNGPVGGGIAFAPHTYAGTLLTDKISAYAFNAGPVPSDMCWIFQGASPLSYDPGTPATAVTAGTATSGGSVDDGTHYYAYTYFGGFGETSIGTSTSAAVVVSGTNQTVPLSTIANTVAQSDCPYDTAANKNLYRTKASGSGTPGSSTNPYFFLAQIAHGTTTYSDTTADASLTAQQPPATQFTYTPAGAFGFPTQPQLAIIGMGANDIGFNYSATNVSNFELALKRLVRAIRRGGSAGGIPPSIIIWNSFMPDGFASDGGAWGSSVDWNQYTDAMYHVAQMERCALLNIDARWQPFAVTNGFATTDVHPSDAGNADEFAALQQLLWLG